MKIQPVDTVIKTLYEISPTCAYYGTGIPIFYTTGHLDAGAVDLRDFPQFFKKEGRSFTLTALACKRYKTLLKYQPKEP